MLLHSDIQGVVKAFTLHFAIVMAEWGACIRGLRCTDGTMWKLVLGPNRPGRRSRTACIRRDAADGAVANANLPYTLNYIVRKRLR